MKTAVLVSLRRRATAWLLATHAALACAAPLHAADRKPNFLFVITDDQRWDTMGVVQREHGERARYPWFKSPAMDRLAAEGVRFRNAFVTLSLCSPSRAAFLTGRYNHLNGIIDNDTALTENSVTHATLLRAAGYHTAYFGKWHMGNQSGQRPGFDHSASFLNQGIYQDCPFEINGVKTPTKGWVDDVSTDLAIDWMKQNREQPFSMVVGFKSPHNKRGGNNLPARLRDLHAGETTRPTPNCGVPPIYRKPDPATGEFDQGLADNAIHLDYLRHIKGVDENLGRLLDSLDQLGLTEYTVVVYTSDNGYFLGEHCLGDKRLLYEESLRVPMLARYPRLFGKGRVVDEMVLNIDLAPTFLDLAGVPVPPAMQGASWKDLAAGRKPAKWRTSFLAEYYRDLGDGPTCFGVRTADAKLVKYPGHPEWTEAFDLTADPYELKNLAADPAFTAKLEAELAAQLKAVKYTGTPKVRRRPPPVDPSLTPVKDEPGLPRVLLIGDSISMGYTVPVRDLLKGKTNLHRIPANGGSTKDGIANIEKWLGNGKWDVIHFNWGLHDLKHWKNGKLDPAGPQLATLAEYETNLRALVKRMQATGAKLIWATTTPVPDGCDGRTAGDELKYNEVASRVMKELGVPTDDLHALCLPKLTAWQQPKNVHFQPAGSAGLAAKVAADIETALKE
jgi:arylsulfatase A-like enzyme/lysophospholipase L1-like esterase